MSLWKYEYLVGKLRNDKSCCSHKRLFCWLTIWSVGHIKLFLGLNAFFYAIVQAFSNKSFYILNIHVDFPWKEGVLITAEHQYYPVFINFISKYLDIALIEFVQTQQQQPLLSLFAWLFCWLTMWSFEQIKLFQALNAFFYTFVQAFSNKAFYFEYT